jgi:pyridinium-3,5-bisthiocarboxylic acid mononucleotide nickel chelatase
MVFSKGKGNMAAILYFDCLSGASGDMILASLVDLGVPVKFLNSRLGRLGIPGLSIKASDVRRNGIVCKQMVMSWAAPKACRHLPDILRIIKRGHFSRKVFSQCGAVLGRLAAAEAKAHGIPESKVHFHEIGAVDTIVDIAGTCLAMDYLKAGEVRFSTLTEGHGTIRTEHGAMPVPAPATARLMKGLHVTRLDIPTELLTPTGAALLTTLGTQALVCPAGVVRKTGHGCGAKVFENHPNYLRAMIVETEEAGPAHGRDMVTVLETDLDHISGEIMGNVAGLLMENGALDVSWSPVYMKKGRPGYRLTVIAPQKKSAALIDVIMIHTRTLGVRIRTAQRVVAEREIKSKTFLGYTVSEKRCGYKGHVFSKIENDDLVKIAKKEKIPVVGLIEKYKAGKSWKK